MTSRPMTLRKHYTVAGAQAALARYIPVTQQRNWRISEKFRLYEAASIARNSTLATNARFDAFEKVYDGLRSYWQVFRSSTGNAGCWNARTTFDNIDSHFANFSYSKCTLLTFDATSQRQSLKKALLAIRNLKSNRYYPVMSVSKFLHFYNPALFPIYDTAMIETVVLRTFWSDYQSFCNDSGLDSDAMGTELYLNYLQWASSTMRSTSPNVMRTFDRFMRHSLANEGTHYVTPSDLDTYYATAFEMIAIGATNKHS